MWLKEPVGNIYEKESKIYNLNFLWQNDNIYIMDNHLAAGWCWLNSLDQEESYNFFHVDQHKDLAGYLSTPEDLDRIKEQIPFDIDRYCSFTFDRGITTPAPPFNRVFSWDNYIKQLQYMFPNWFSDCYFACTEYVTDNPRYTKFPLNIVYNATNLDIYNNINYWLSQTPGRKWIFNLDLDYFFNSEGMQLYSDEYIRAFACNLYESLDNIAVLSIAMSPECCGNWKKSLHVLKIFSEVFGLEEVLKIFV